jgi:acyl-coenzyme A thioesterase PaaI-like protein
MKEYSINLEEIRRRYQNNVIEFVRLSGVYLDLVEERHVRLVLPLGAMHLNHVGIAYAGSIYLLGEVSSAAILYSNYGTDTYIPIASKSELEFLKPATKDLVVDFSMDETEAARLIEPIEARGGKGRLTLIYPIRDVDGVEVAKMTSVLYLAPRQTKE